MATYAIGDIQGCFDSFARLIARIDFDPTRDRLWLVGDLVNRGPKNAEVLRWCVEHEPLLQVVLGNHDLHLLAASEGLRKPKGRDTLQDVLRARDRAALLDYLWRQPFLHELGDYVMVHAGIPPRWTWPEARRRAAALTAALRGPDRRRVLAAIAGAAAPPEYAPLAEDAAALTRMRTVDRTRTPVYGFAGPPDEAPPGQRPWFETTRAAAARPTLLFGHWAALGLRVRDDVVALDSGCVWGQRLTAFRLEDRTVFQVDAVERR